MRRRSDLPEVKALLQARIVELCKQLAPDGYRSGNYWMARNPTRNDRHAGSFWVSIHGRAVGAWRDEATDDKGDVFGLIGYIHGGEFKDALTWARGWLGLAEMPPAQRRAYLEQVEEKRAAEERREAQQLLDDQSRARGTWLHSRPSLLGTPAETYLAGRGIPLRVLSRQPRALRFSPAQKHGESGQSWPAIVAAMTGTSGKIVAIHRTFLARDGSAKAPIAPQRKIWPRIKGQGAAIHLWRGETGLPHTDAEKQGLWDTLVITEGIEDGLSVAVACPECRVWVAGSLRNLGEIQLPACSAEVIVCADNDWGRPEAQAALDGAVLALMRQGRRTIKIARSSMGKDGNDALRAELEWTECGVGR